MDQNREIRAMILASLPYPPLPVEAKRLEDDNKLGDVVVTTSHDILSHLLEAICVQGNASIHKNRQERQRQVLRMFLSDLVKDGIQGPEALYRTYCKHTVAHIATYYPEGAIIPELRFMPLGHVCRGDQVHRMTCDYIAAQARILELQGGFCAADWGTRNYVDLLLEARNRLVCEGDPTKIIVNVPEETREKKPETEENEVQEKFRNIIEELD